MKMGSFPRAVVLVCLVTMLRSVASQQTYSDSTSCTSDLKRRCACIVCVGGRELLGTLIEGKNAIFEYIHLNCVLTEHQH